MERIQEALAACAEDVRHRGGTLPAPTTQPVPSLPDAPDGQAVARAHRCRRYGDSTAPRARPRGLRNLRSAPLLGAKDARSAKIAALRGFSDERQSAERADSDYVRGRKRRIVTAPDRVLLSGSRSILG